jgi:hypothetical protein
MSAQITLCPRCGAPAPDPICKFCGSLTARLQDVGAERQALHAFHTLVTKQADAKKQAEFLSHGFLPEHQPVLIEAGVQCVTLIDLEQPAQDVPRAAVRRLRGIIFKMKLTTETPDSARAIKQFEVLLRDHARSESKALWQGIGLIIVLPLVVIALCIGGIWLLFGR